MKNVGHAGKLVGQEGHGEKARFFEELRVPRDKQIS